MPENTYFRDPKVQAGLLDVLFVYCSQNKDIGYRQGFHELAAIVWWVVDCDAVKEGEGEEEEEEGAVMGEVLDSRFVRHDTFAIFSRIMEKVRGWYELGERGDMGPIVKKSKYIHETLLMATDPQLAEHLKALDVLPQVFLM